LKPIFRNFLLCAFIFGSLARYAWSDPIATTRPAAQIAIGVFTEEGQKLIRATVTMNGKPVENASVVFGVRRTFGDLIIGEDKTLDDGTAAARFPADLPGGPAGELTFVATIKSPPELAGSRTEATVGGGVKRVPETEPFPRALWSPHAPMQLVVPIVVLLGGVWVTYVFVVGQIIAIRWGAKHG
jgi:hypothetical protein